MGAFIFGVVGLAVTGACFNSDDKLVDEPGTTTGETYGPNPTTTEGGDETTTGEDPEVDCEDAIDCLIGCSSVLLDEDFDPNEPDLSCFIECESGLSVEEALELLRLTECLTNRCVEAGACDTLDETTGGTTGGDTGGTGDTDGPEFPCLDCLSTLVQDPEPPGCTEEASACRD
jgi:hypothetical protein